ncbi:MAG: pyrroline-5-carboxylate reductase [Ruminococcaceae bacterium]|nr:pyrroline-5-carboxylate reductase [Oscillospiraceae bacterium]
MNKTLGFIGCGNMGSAIIKGVLNSKTFLSVNAYDIKRNDELDVNYLNSINELVQKSDIILLCVKPNMFKQILTEIKQCDYKEKIFVSIAAGITKEFIKQILGDVMLVRVMPNLPLCVGEGMSVVCADDNINEENLEAVKMIFAFSGKISLMNEDYINKALAVNGSGPAYVFMFIEAMADSLVKNGVARDESYKIAAQTVLGSAKMLLETNLHPGILKDMVCSPAGTTIEAVIELEKRGFRYSVMDAIEKCTQKANDMSKK